MNTVLLVSLGSIPRLAKILGRRSGSEEIARAQLPSLRRHSSSWPLRALDLYGFTYLDLA